MPKVVFYISSSCGSKDLGYELSIINLTIYGEDFLNKPENNIRVEKIRGDLMGIGAELGFLKCFFL